MFNLQTRHLWISQALYSLLDRYCVFRIVLTANGDIFWPPGWTSQLRGDKLREFHTRWPSEPSPAAGYTIRSESHPSQWSRHLYSDVFNYASNSTSNRFRNGIWSGHARKYSFSHKTRKNLKVHSDITSRISWMYHRKTNAHAEAFCKSLEISGDDLCFNIRAGATVNLKVQDDRFLCLSSCSGFNIQIFMASFRVMKHLPQCYGLSARPRRWFVQDRNIEGSPVGVLDLWPSNDPPVCLPTYNSCFNL